MNLIEAILMGIIQGATEFLPVSSSGHLAIFKCIFKVNTDTGILFDLLLHFGTLIAIFIVYWKDIWELIVEGVTIVILFFKNVVSFVKYLRTHDDKYRYKKIVTTPYRKFVMLVIVSTLVTMVLALPFKNIIEGAGEKLIVPGLCLLITSAVLFVADRLPIGDKDEKTTTYKNSIFVGIAQGIATLPGISRSGSTITAGLACGFNREFAVKYSFIMSIPAVLGSCILEIPDLFKSDLNGGEVVNYIVGMIVAAVVGYICIKAMLITVKKNKFKGFSIYCLCAGLISIVCYFVL